MRNVVDGLDVWDEIRAMPTGVKFRVTDDERVMVSLSDHNAVRNLLNALPVFRSMVKEEALEIKNVIIQRLLGVIVGMSLVDTLTKEEFLEKLESAFDTYPDLKWYVFVVIKYLFSDELADQVHELLEEKVRAVISHPKPNVGFTHLVREA